MTGYRGSPPVWWQRYVAGEFRSPQALYGAARAELMEASNMEVFRRQDIRAEPFDPASGWAGVARLQVPKQWFTSDQAMRQNQRADWQHTPPALQAFAFRLIELARARGVPLYVHTAYRDPAAQRAALEAGNTLASFGRSAHSIGYAVDIVHGRFHWDMNRDEWNYIGALGREALRQHNAGQKAADLLSLTWGGNFMSLWDPAHWEIEDYRSHLGPRSTGDPVRAWPRSRR